MTAILGQGCFGGDRAQGPIRPPAVAGQFYPSDPGKLRLAVEEFVKSAVPPVLEKPIALVVPHAGYVFSGQVCADGFRQASGHRYDTVVILGTNHTAPGFDGIAIQSKGGYRTPLGVASVDEAVAAEILAAGQELHLERRAFREGAFGRGAGALRSGAIPGSADRSRRPRDARPRPVQPLRGCAGRSPAQPQGADRGKFGPLSLPGLRHCGFGRPGNPSCHRSARPGGNRRQDQGSGTRRRRAPDTCACGEAPRLAAAAAAKKLGATTGAVLSYANSGDTLAGDLSRVVGYGAVAFASGPVNQKALQAFAAPAAPAAAEPLKAAEKKWLLDFARTTIRRYLTTETLPLPRGFPPRLQFRQGAFVTLRKGGELRGCIGHMAEDSPLSRTVGSVAMEAAFNDSRFNSLTLSELGDIKIEVSVLTPARPVAGDKDIVLGRDGVILSKSGRSAVFLPQVATEQGWGTPELLENLCRKAGLPPGSWKSGAQLFTFQAEVFHEEEF